LNIVGLHATTADESAYATLSLYGSSVTVGADPGGTELLRVGGNIRTSGKLGIGVSPGAPFDALLGTTGRVRFSTDGTNGAFSDFLSADALTWNKHIARATQMSFLVSASGAPTNGLIITPTAPGVPAANNVLIGAGQIRAGAGITAGGKCQFGAATTPADGSITISNTDPAMRLRVSTGTMDAKQYDIRAIAAVGYEYLQIRKINDANTSFTDLLKIWNSGKVEVPSTLPSSNPTNGALVVKGGVGVAGTLNVAGNISANGNMSAVVTGDAVTTVNGTTGAYSAFQTPLAIPSGVAWQQPTGNIWTMYKSGTPSADLTITAYDNAGAVIDVPLSIPRAAGQALTISRPVAVLNILTAKEIKVTTTGADYVFDPGYKLMPLSEVAAYVQREKHLPEMMSAKDMQAGGMPVSEVVTKQLAKIEELTLHAIDADQKATALQNRADMLAQDNERLRLQQVAQDAKLTAILARLEALENR